VAVGGGVPVAAIDGGAARWAAVTGRERGGGGASGSAVEP
jgi:hypothetical protein